jgi:DNA topoisomerase-1
MTERTMILATMSDSDDDVPLGARMPQAVKRPAPKADSSDSDDDVPLGARMPAAKPKPKKKPASASKPKPKKRKVDSDSDSDDEPIGSLMKKSGGAKARVAKSPAAKKRKSGGGASSPPWVKSGAKKMWTTLEHCGVVFPPAYEPNGVPLTYDGKDVVLLPHEEEVANFFAVMKDTDYAQKDVFVNNFWDGFKKILRNGPHAHIKEFSKCDFTKMYAWHLEEREKKKAIPNDEKKRAKAAKEKEEEKYTWATIDGRKEKVGNYRVEPPGLFRGRGEHPKMGRIKKRIMPEDITINCGKDAKVPEPPPGHKWKEVIHNDTVTWLCGWNDSVNTKDWKYVQFGATSSIKAESDIAKYEKARKLKDSVEKIRRDYFAKMKKGDPLEQQLAVTTYLVDKLALRAGGEKDEDLADTVGVCTLRVGHVEFMPPSTLKFDFLGKDSIRYLQEHEVDPLVFAAMSKFCKGKKPEHDIFDKIDPTKVNKHLQSLMPGLTIKVFRTYNASYVLNKLLREETPDGTVMQKKAAYDAANKEVAVLCNHQKGVSKAHDAQMEKLEDKRKAMAKELASLRKEKLDKNKGKIATLKERLAKLELNIKMKDELKTVSLGTSKINYLDPRITIAWCKRQEVPPPTVFTRALIEKFNWSMEVEPTFDF